MSRFATSCGRPHHARSGGTVARMPIPRRYTTDAIVLSRFDLGEADRVLTLITPGIGKLKAIAKGVRRPTSRLGGSLEPFAELTVALARGRTFDVVTQVSVGHAWLNLRDSLEIGRDRLVPRRARRPVARGAPRGRAAVRAAATGLRAARRRDGAGPGRPLVRDAPARRARPAARGRPLRRVRPRARGGGALPLGPAARRGPVRALSRPAHDRTGISLEALKLLKAYQRLDIEAIAELRLAPDVERETEAALREFVRDGARARRALAGLPRRGPRRRC